MFLQYIGFMLNDTLKAAKDAVAEMNADEVEAMLIAISHALNETANSCIENDNEAEAEHFTDAAFSARTAARDLSKRAGN